MKIAGMWMRVGWFVILLTLRSAWGIAETYQYAFGTYTPDEAVRLTNQCSTLYKFNCGTADIKVTVPLGTSHSQLTGELLPASPTHGIKFNTTLITHKPIIGNSAFRFSISFKIKDFGTGKIFLLKADDQKIGSVYCNNDVNHRLFFTYYTPGTPAVLVTKDTAINCVKDMWINLMYYVNNNAGTAGSAGLVVKQRSDATDAATLISDGSTQSLAIDFTSPVMEIGNNFNGYIHTILLEFATADSFTISKSLFNQCHSDCDASYKCVASYYSEAEARNCLYSNWRCQGAYEELDKSCTACKTGVDLDTTNLPTCPCNSGYFDDGAACTQCITAGNWRCHLCKSATSCQTCSHIIGMNESSATCACRDDYTEGTNDCVYNKLTCGLFCDGCASESVCQKCLVRTGVTKAPPCECDAHANFVLLGPGTCVCKEGYYLAHNNTCLHCGHKCKICVSTTGCKICAGATGVGTTPPICSCLDGFYDSGTSCAPCDWKCKTCSSADSCNECKTETGISNTLPKCSCAKGYFDYQGGCNKCGLGCSTCEDQNTCAICDTSLRGRVSTPPCVCNYRKHFLEKTSGDCDCMDGYFLKVDQCVSCGWTCATCTGANTCGRCKIGVGIRTMAPCGCDEDHHFVESGGECICKDGYLLQDGACVSCGWACKTCATPTVCATCKEGPGMLTLLPCGCDLPNSYVENPPSLACALCSPGTYPASYHCASCKNISDLCTKCGGPHSCTECITNAHVVFGSCSCDSDYHLEGLECVSKQKMIQKVVEDDDDDDDKLTTITIIVLAISVCIIILIILVGIILFCCGFCKNKPQEEERMIKDQTGDSGRGINRGKIQF